MFEGVVIPHCSKKELKRYISCTDPALLKHYKTIRSVANNEILIIE